MNAKRIADNIQMPNIDWTKPKAEIRWRMAGASCNTFVITLEDFLLCAATTDCEAAFRAAFYRMGRVEEERRPAVSGASA
jgi:hypothetical protein